MAGANSNISLVGLDFNDIKSNFQTYLKSQDTFKDYNFEGSGLSVLLDVLAYNTQYNAFYLNMVANEMFLDTALQRASVVSHAKLLNYIPKSQVSAKAKVNIKVTNVTLPSLTLPAYTNFYSEPINDVHYNFITTESTTAITDNTNTVYLNNVELTQGIYTRTKFVVDSVANPNFIFELPDSSVDTSTILVSVQQSSSNNYSTTFNKSSDYLSLNGNTPVYFLEETLKGTYQISFGNGILGQKLVDGNIVNVTYILTQGPKGNGANNFVLMDTPTGFSSLVQVTGVSPSSGGLATESIDSIKYQAPKTFSAQSRAVTKDDYITLIQQNNIDLTFDAVNVWGGEENDPPVYGQVFICLKPAGAYTITDTQKQKLINDVLKPISVVTVEPTILDPDYTYVVIDTTVVYNPKVTNYNLSQIHDLIYTSISNYCANNLNTFNSTFASTDVAITIKSADPSIVTSEVDITLQKKFQPDLTNTTNYTLHYNTPLNRGLFTSGITSSPGLSFYNSLTANTISNVFIEEVPTATSGVQAVSIINPGYSYQYVPTISISGDGSGATAEAVLSSTGSISSINMLTSGNNYSYATVTVTPNQYDTTGVGAEAIAVLTGSLGTLRSYYYNNNNAKTILNPNVGSVDYQNGIIYLNSFGPTDVNNPLGQLTISATPKSQILSSSYNNIVTVDPFDPNAIIVNVTSQ